MTPTLTQKGQVTVPKEIRDRLGLKPGDKVRYEVNDRGRVEIEKAEDRIPEQDLFLDLVGIAGPGLTTDEVMRVTRGEDWNKP